MFDGIHDFVMADIVGGGFFLDEGDRAGGFEDGAIDFGQGADSLAVGGGDQLGAGDHFAVEMIAQDTPVAEKIIALSRDEYFQRLVPMDEADDEVIDDKKRGSAEEAAGDGVVVADDGILDSVGEGEQNDQIERIELGQFAFAGQAEADEEKKIDDDGTEDLFKDGKLEIKHVGPGDMHVGGLSSLLE